MIQRSFEVELSEVCGTDVYLQQGRLQGVPYPLVPGHVSVGQVKEDSWRGCATLKAASFVKAIALAFLDVHRHLQRLLVLSGRQSHDALSEPEESMGSPTDLMMGCAEAGPNKSISSPARVASGSTRSRKLLWPAAARCRLRCTPSNAPRSRLETTVLVLGSGPVGTNAIILSLMRGALSVLYRRAMLNRLKAAARGRRIGGAQL